MKHICHSPPVWDLGNCPLLCSAEGQIRTSHSKRGNPNADKEWQANGTCAAVNTQKVQTQLGEVSWRKGLLCKGGSCGKLEKASHKGEKG